MRLRLIAISLGFASFFGNFASPALHAQSRDQQIVAKVGPAVITVADVERRLATIPAYQLATFGKTPSEIRRRFVEQVLVPDALFAAGGRARKLDERPEVRAQLKGALRTARLSALRTDTAERGIPTEEVRRYYEENKNKFEAPERILVFRILCKTKDDAAQVLTEAKKAGTIERWNELARAHSIDKATAMRGGDLGFLSPDGSSQHQGVKADPALVAAAAKAKDGEILDQPVPEGSGFAVLWRRGSLPAVRRAIENETDSISQVLWRKKLEEARSELLSKLRQDKVRDVTRDLVELLEINPQSEIGLQKRPGVAQRPAVGRPAPSVAPGQLR